MAIACKQNVVALVLIIFLGLGSRAVHAETVVHVQTNLGEFYLQLFDEVAPKTVSNFINYVLTGRYENSIVHRLVPGFVIQGGRLKVPQELQFELVPVGPSVVNEPHFSNTRGTIAMARVGGQVDSATSQWFINLADNTSLDFVDEGFTVFGVVLGSGMDVVDQIAASQIVNLTGLGISLPEFPLTNFDGTLRRESLIIMDMTLVSGDFTPPNVLDDVNADVSIKVNGGTAGIAQLTLDIVSTSPSVIVQVMPDTIVPLTEVETGFSVFNANTGQLLIPELSVNGGIAYKNLLFNLTNPELLQFTLVSVE